MSKKRVPYNIVFRLVGYFYKTLAKQSETTAIIYILPFGESLNDTLLEKQMDFQISFVKNVKLAL